MDYKLANLLALALLCSTQAATALEIKCASPVTKQLDPVAVKAPVQDLPEAKVVPAAKVVPSVKVSEPAVTADAQLDWDAHEPTEVYAAPKPVVKVKASSEPVQAQEVISTMSKIEVAPAKAKVVIKGASKDFESKSASVCDHSTGIKFNGMADYYHHSMYGRRTASGKTLHKHLMTCAHRTLPFGTRVKVHNHYNGKSCVVVVNDRGPFTKSKVIDLSHAAATQIDMLRAGTCKVSCEVLE